MALDGLVVRAIVQQLQSVVGGRINKIHTPSTNDVLLQIRARNGNVRLLLSANPTYPRVHVTQENFPNPADAPIFCMLLRKYCEGGTIEAVEQIGNERIIRLHIKHRDNLGDIGFKIIHVEIMGRHSNIILLDATNELIVDSIHHVTPAISSHRIVLPGSTFIAPPDQHKLDPFEISVAAFCQHMTENKHAGNVEEQIVQLFSGISPLVAKEIVYRAGDKYNPEQLWTSFHTLLSQARDHNYEPNITTKSDAEKDFFSVIALTHLGEKTQPFNTISECLEAYYTDKALRDTVKQRMADLLRFLQNEKNKNIKKLEKLATAIKEAKGADDWRRLGELLTASMHLSKKGDAFVEVVDYYDEAQPTVIIPLDPLLTPSENTQRYFKKYNKYKHSLLIVEQQEASTQTEIEYLNSLLQQINNATLDDIAEIREELIGQGYIRERNQKTRKKLKAKQPILSCFTSSEGILIYVGKNNTQNDFLTNKFARQTDTWLHTKEIHGSHVVIRATEYGEETLHEAAQLAAYFSQARQSSQVPVDYTIVKYVHKPSGAKPGFVIYDHQKTIFITPDEQQIKQMKCVKL